MGRKREGGKARALDPEKSGWFDGKLVLVSTPVARPLPPMFFAAQKDPWSWLLWRPAFFMYLLVFGSVVAATRARCWRFLLIAVPVELQTLGLAMFCPAPEFRYQWSVYLTGMLIGGFLLWAVPRGGYGAARRH